MPAPLTDLLLPTETSTAVTVLLEPAHNIVHDLKLLLKADEVSGFDDWVYRTAAALTPEERDMQGLVMIGFYFAITPRQSWPSFPAYLEHLASVPAEYLRDKLFDAYLNLPCYEPVPGEAEMTDQAEILADANSFLRFLRQRFPEDHVIPEIERRAYSYLLDPPAMQQLIVGHLRHMWHKYLAVEWERVRPMLQKAVLAFQQLDLSRMSRQLAAEQVLGRPVTDETKWVELLEEKALVTFVPSAHVGPYMGTFFADDRLWVLFGARQPEGVDVDAPELSRAEILVRLGALADDTRLSILRYLAETGEQRSQDVIQALDLSQSAASRHLQQLTATGFLSERRCNGAKCYQLNDERVDDTLRAVSAYLTGPHL